jgi:hypothetical protein
MAILAEHISRLSDHADLQDLLVHYALVEDDGFVALAAS